MTRFARAIGSKSSNKRVPDDATPWNELKNSQAKSVVSQPKVVKKIKWKKKEGEYNGSENVTPDESLPGDKKEYKRRKPLTDYPLIKDGKEVTIVRFEGFPVRKEDAERLKELKKKLLTLKIPHHEIKRTMQLERRRAEKILSREKKQVCFHCRQSGHILSQCPNLSNNAEQALESGICFKCGSTEHQHTQCRVVSGENYKYANCFICKQEGHISKQCPDNPRGLYPEGGSCRICGDVTHMKRDCPRFSKKKKEDFEITLSTLDSRKLEVLEDDLTKKNTTYKPHLKKKKIIKM